MSNLQADVIIISNGPGELSTWVKPVVSQLRAEMPQVRITIALVPCPYASGFEMQTVASWNMGLRVWSPDETVRFLLRGKQPTADALRDFGVVLFMGGDQFFGVMMSQRTGYPVMTYTETTGRWSPWVEKFLASDRATFLRMRAKRISQSRIALVGNLMVDAVRPNYDPNAVRDHLQLSPDAKVIGLLPGSKPFKVKYITPMLLKVAEMLWVEDPAYQFVLHLSPFTPLAQLEEALNSEALQRVTGGCGGRIVTIKDQPYIFTPNGAQIRILGPEHHYAGMAIADLALTIPGTNTAELAILGVPMIVLLPLNKPEEIPLDGLLGQIGNLPLIGKPLKRLAVGLLARRLAFTALPNQRAGRAITPELKGVITPQDVFDLASSMLENDEARRAIRLELFQAMGYPGAAAAITSLVRESLMNVARHPHKAPHPAPQEQQESN